MAVMDRWYVLHPTPIWHDPSPGLSTCPVLQTLISPNTSWYKWTHKVSM